MICSSPSITGHGYDTLAAAILQRALKDCVLGRRDRRVDATAWLLRCGDDWAKMINVSYDVLTDVLRRLVTPQTYLDAIRYNEDIACGERVESVRVAVRNGRLLIDDFVLYQCFCDVVDEDDITAQLLIGILDGSATIYVFPDEVDEVRAIWSTLCDDGG